MKILYFWALATLVISLSSCDDNITPGCPKSLDLGLDN